MDSWLLFMSAFTSGWIGFSLITGINNKLLIIFLLVLNLAFCLYRIHRLGGF